MALDECNPDLRVNMVLYTESRCIMEYRKCRIVFANGMVLEKVYYNGVTVQYYNKSKSRFCTLELPDCKNIKVIYEREV